MDPAQVDLEDMIAEVEAEEDDEEPVDDSPEITGIPDGDRLSDTDDEFDADAEMQEMKTEEIIKEKIAEDEAAVAEVCDQVTDAEALELIKGQEAVDQQMAQEAASDNSVSDENVDFVMKGEPDFELDFASTDEDDVESGDVDFDFA